MTLRPAAWAGMILFTVLLGYFTFGRGKIDYASVSFVALLWTMGFAVFFYDAARCKRLLTECLKFPIISGTDG